MKTVKRKSDNLLLSLRMKLGMRQEEMANHVGIGQTAYKMAEQGRRTISTAALIKIADLEIRLNNKTQEPGTDKPYPLETLFIKRYRRDFQVLFSKELIYRKQVLTLQLKLERVRGHYKKCREWLALLEDAVKEMENDGRAANPWKKQQQAAIKRLERCNMPVQLLLKLRIELLEAEASLYRSMQEKLRRELPEFFEEESH